MLTSVNCSDPTSNTEAVKHPVWWTAMPKEVDALHAQGTWSLVPRTSAQNVLWCKCIYKTKYNLDDTIARPKALLVVEGYKQEYGVDYLDTFNPVVKLPTSEFCLLSPLLLNDQSYNLIYQMRFCMENYMTVYMTQSPCFQHSQHPDYACHHKMSIYGLQQSPCQWLSTFFLTCSAIWISNKFSWSILSILSQPEYHYLYLNLCQWYFFNKQQW